MVRATVIKIARAIIILKPAFLVAPSPGRWSRKQEAAEGWWNDRGVEEGRGREGRRERYAVDIGRGTGRRRWKRMAAAVTVTEAGRPRRTAGALALRARWGLKFGTTDCGRRGVRWRRAAEGGSFISLPHGIIYREDFRESTQRAPR